MAKGKPRKSGSSRKKVAPTVMSLKPGHKPGKKPGKGLLKANRSCGECTACCTAMAIVELDKPEFSACEKLNTPDGAPGSRPGCADYHNRPASCRGFRCAWLNGFPMTDASHRPDRLGLILIPTIDPQAIQVREVWPNASQEVRAQHLITELRRAGLRVELVSERAQQSLQPLTVFGRPTMMVRPMAPAPLPR